MRRLFNNIKIHTVEILNLDSMSYEYHILAANYIFLVIYVTLESVFVNTLLYRIKPDISIVIIYRGITYIASAIMMHLAAYIGQKKTPLLVIKLGGVFYLLMYAVLFFGMDHMNILMYVTAVLSGTGGAFYWAGHNTLIPHYTKASNRDIGISILCVIQGGASLFVPIFSGGVISLTENTFGSTDIGYRIMFGLGMMITAAQVRYQRKLTDVPHQKQKSAIVLALSLFAKKVSYKFAMCYELLRGFRDGTFGFILNMILFELVTSESLVGLNAFLTGIMAIIGAWAYGKLVKPKLRPLYTLAATTAMIVFCSILLIKSSAPLVMLFAMVNSFFALFVSNICGNSTIDLITQSKAARNCVGESVAIREVFLCIGRLAGLYVFTMFPSSMSGKIWAMLILTASQYLIALFLMMTFKAMNKERALEETEDRLS